MRILFVYNPFSGRALIKEHLYEILLELNKLDAEIVIHPTTRRMDAHDYIVSNEGKFDLIVCSGGDGTLNECVSALMKAKECKPTLGYIPSGSTNDFAKSLGIPKKMKVAAQHIVDGMSQKVDVGRFNDKYFTYVAAMGVFTEVSYATPQNMKNILGHQAYILEGIKQLTSIKSEHLIIKSDIGMIEGDFIFGMVTNTKSVGGYKGITGKNVHMNDGKFEVTFIRNPSNPAQLQSIITSLFMQDYVNDLIYFDHVNHIEISSPSPVKWVLDGEFGGAVSDVSIDVIHNAYDIMLNKEIK